MDVIQTALLSWYQNHQRDLPWRADPKPYHIWLSEVILQQTRVAQGLSYYHRFLDAFPSVQDLADAPLDEVLKLWQGLGYYNRARNLHAAASQVVNEYGGEFPTHYSALLGLKGVGPYTAAAIASIAFGEAKAVVDGNVIRVLSRFYAIEESVQSATVQREIQSRADELLNSASPGDHNQAMMELGATVCTPKQPKCGHCPLSSHCLGYQKGIAQNLPLKVNKTKRRTRYFHYLVVCSQDHVYVHQRDENDIWAGLFEFPLIETTEDRTLVPEELLFTLGDAAFEVIRINQVPKHVLSHQDLFARFYHIAQNDPSSDRFRHVGQDILHTFALPRLIDRYLENYALMDGKKLH